VQEQEGVIKYQLDFSDGEAPNYEHFELLNYWRCYLFRLHLIGQDARRYGGLGYGNISARLHPGSNDFIISATQTGHLPLLCREHYVHVTGFDLTHNQLRACGTHQPSSEALTHASIYAGRPDVNCVIHVHCPRIWLLADELGVPTTAGFAYGTPELAQQVQRMVQARKLSRGVIATRGHEDGVLIYGEDEDAAGGELCELLQRVGDCFPVV